MTPPEQAALLLQQNRPAEALMLCRQALEAEPRDLRTRYFLADLSLKLGSLTLAVATLVDGLDLVPEDVRLRRGLVNVLNGRAQSPKEMPQNLEAWLMRGLEERWPNAIALVPQAFAMVHIRRKLGDGDLSDEQARALMEDPLFRAVIGIGFYGISPLEKIVRDLRRRALTEKPDIGFLTPLAIGCYFSQYILSVTPEEEALVAKLSRDETTDLCLIACYKPLYSLGAIGAALPRILVQIQIAEPLAEREIAESLPALKVIEDEVSLSVQAMYEESPYPRWTADDLTLAGAPVGVRQEIQRQTGVLVPELTFDDDAPELLEAGCGTGQQLVRMAVSMPKAEITAVDLSRTSLAYAKSRTDPLCGDQIDYWQGSLLDLGTKDWQFDVISCTGVLHHMEKPDDGWKALAGVLRPGGHMFVALYSQAARAPVIAAQKLIAEAGWPATPEGIRKAREAIAALPPDHPAKDVMMGRDFYYLSEVRDLLFHVQEHFTTLPDIGEALKRVGLIFTGMKFPNSQVAQAFLQRFGPDPAKAQTLANWEMMEAENPDLFRSMYQFWCRKET